jgi:uncharacterized protein YxeA
MKKELKIVILVVLAMALGGIYFGRNIYGGKNKQAEQLGQNVQQQKGLPTMIEFKTDT